MIKEIFGTDSLQQFGTLFFFALIGVAISLLMHSNNRDQNSSSTPVKFSVLFLLKDNWKRIVLSLLLIYVTLRFFTDLTGLHLSSFFSLCVGVGWDKLSQIVKEKTEILCVNRNKNQ